MAIDMFLFFCSCIRFHDDELLNWPKSHVDEKIRNMTDENLNKVLSKCAFNHVIENQHKTRWRG